MASGALNPLANYNPPLTNTPDAWDVCQIEGTTCPGHCEIRGFDRKWNWDKKTGKGAQGTRSTYTGKPAVEGEIEFFLYTGQHFAQWEKFRPLFKYNPTKTSTQAVHVDHPSLADIDVTALVCESIAPIRHLGLNYFSCIVKFSEFVPPPPAAAVATPTTAATGKGAGASAGGTLPSPLDPLQARVAALTKQFQTT
jgi:hypothetical protein